LTALSKRTFTIVHTQSGVLYQAVGFVMKNRDEANKELEDAVCVSGNAVIKEIFARTAIKQAKTLGASFRKEMSQLMAELESCEVHFVRCIKPNELKRRDYFIWNYTL
jgi:myosin heavy subunit